VRWILQILAATLLLTRPVASASIQQPVQPLEQDTNTGAAATPTAYPDTPEGLKTLLDDIFAAVKTNNSAKYSAYFGNLSIPDNGAWLLQTFDATEGPRLKEKYLQLQPLAAANLKKLFDYPLQGNRTNVTVQVYQKGSEPKLGVIRAALEAMSGSAKIYTAYGSNPADKYSVALGNFIYVDDGFRFLDGQVLQALSTAPPARIRMGGNVMLAKLANKVQPIYPPEAQAEHLKGTVRLHVVLGTDGTPKEVSVVTGDPVLAKAAVDAVTQWRYVPTLLNGAPVEVDTTIDVEFR